MLNPDSRFQFLIPLLTCIACLVGIGAQAANSQQVTWPSVPNLEPKISVKQDQDLATKESRTVDEKALQKSFELPKFNPNRKATKRQFSTTKQSPSSKIQPASSQKIGPANLPGYPATAADPVLTPVANPKHAFVKPIIDEQIIPWWRQRATRSFTQHKQNVTPEILIMLALQSSPRLRAISREPMIREYAINESKSRFDPEAFLETQFDDRNDPVGNQLTTGGLPFLEDHTWYAEGGLRKKLLHGGDLEVSQRVGFQNSNSRFFDPQDQGTSTLFINFSQPLLRGRGKVFNRSQIVIAELSTDIAWEKYVQDLQLELESLVIAYWNLYYTRSVWLQKQNNVNRGQAILNILEKRSELDSTPTQIARARAAVLLRQTELANARRDIQNAETEIRRLIGSVNVGRQSSLELVPTESPNFILTKDVAETVAADALHYRPEVREAFQRAKVTSVQLNVSKNELMPELTLLLGTYFSALEGDSGIFRSLQRQYSETTPGYYAGFNFKYPLRNRAAKSRRDQTAVRLARVQDEIDQISQTVISESVVALRRLDSAYQTLQSSSLAIKAAEVDLRQQTKRWEAFGLVEGDLSEGQNPTTILDQLLDAQQRLANAELTFSRAEIEFKSAEIGLRRVTGKLLQQHRIQFGRTQDDITRIEPFQETPRHQRMIPNRQPNTPNMRHEFNVAPGEAKHLPKQNGSQPLANSNGQGPNKPNQKAPISTGDSKPISTTSTGQFKLQGSSQIPTRPASNSKPTVRNENSHRSTQPNGGQVWQSDSKAFDYNMRARTNAKPNGASRRLAPYFQK